MPSSVWDVLAPAGLTPDGGVKWGERVPKMGPGVYVVALTADVKAGGPTLETCPISTDAVEGLLEPDRNFAWTANDQMLLSCPHEYPIAAPGGVPVSPTITLVHTWTTDQKVLPASRSGRETT
jgi:hypothetical protein